MMAGIRSADRSRRRGAVVVLTVVSIVMLLLCASLAVDVGYICALAAEQQNNADAGALAGASALQDGDSWDAEDRVLRIIARNQRPQLYLSLEDQIIEFGWFDTYNNVFHPVADPSRAFAVRVRAARNRAPLFFASIMGRYTTDVSREAIAAGSRPCTGIWGLEGITAGSILTDSYDSTEQPYSVVTAGNEGDLCSGRGITIHGSIEVNGDVMAGFGHEVNVCGSSGAITGLTTSNVDGLPPVPVDLGDAAFTNDNDTIPLTNDGRPPFQKGNLAVDIQGGDNLTLPPGTYYFTSIKLGGGATITITGPTTIYVSGPIDTTGGTIVNALTDPHDLTIVSMGSTVKIGGGAEFFGSVMAPNAVVELKGEAFYGALVGRYVEFSGDFLFHVDESLPLAQQLFDIPPPMLVR
jgi:hypothetical protein